MKILTLVHDIPTFCVTAESFPNEINKAFERLIEKLPTEQGRIFFGIAFQEATGSMVYKAAVKEDFPGEANRCCCEIFMIRKGDYITETVKNWKTDITSIGKTFQKLGESHPNATFPCVEWYKGNDVLCMVRLEH
ncbi:MAG: transcriptional regulator [Cyclobacteriaceae bacterium]|nr:transcriptional regulator [Cyclobacteriaceae bacterium]